MPGVDLELFVCHFRMLMMRTKRIDSCDGESMGNHNNMGRSLQGPYRVSKKPELKKRREKEKPCIRKDRSKEKEKHIRQPFPRVAPGGRYANSSDLSPTRRAPSWTSGHTALGSAPGGRRRMKITLSKLRMRGPEKSSFTAQ